MLGQGLRFGSNLVAAPFKSGKSLLLLNVALNQVLKEKPIPIYYVNAEMDHEDTLGRMIANITETNIYDIETGKFAKSVQTESRVQNRVSQLGDLPFYHLHAVDMSFDEQLHRMKNWLFKHVGLDTEQQANPCLIVYDYIKVMGDDGKRIGRNIREDMVVGEIFSKLHEFGKQYGVYVLTAAQMNRMGEVGLSIRLEQSANNICFLREKTDDEKQQERGGNFRLRLHASRYSARMVDSDYLNLQIELPHFRIQEGKFRREIIEEDLQQSMNPTVPTSNSLNM
jgi:replicative DNA helicase